MGNLPRRFAPIPCCIGYWRRHILSSTFEADHERLFNSGIEFLRNFVRISERKLQALGFSYDIESLDKQWSEYRTKYFCYLPYNKAMLMLRLGLFKDAKAEFKKFKKLDNSVKTDLIYGLISLSNTLKIDLVNPLAELKSKF